MECTGLNRKEKYLSLDFNFTYLTIIETYFRRHELQKFSFKEKRETHVIKKPTICKIGKKQ